MNVAMPSRRMRGATSEGPYSDLTAPQLFRQPRELMLVVLPLGSARSLHSVTEKRIRRLISIDVGQDPLPSDAPHRILVERREGRWCSARLLDTDSRPNRHRNRARFV